MTKLFIDAGIIAITAFISPYRKDRQSVRSVMGEEFFLEIYVKCPIDVCESRDPKGIYKKARQGDIKNFTGVSAPYEPPEYPDLIIESDKEDIQAAVAKVIQLMQKKKIIAGEASG